MVKFSRVLRGALVASGALFLAACSTVPSQTTGTTAPPAAQGTTPAATAPSTSASAPQAHAAVPQESPLTSELLYRLMVAEIAGQRGDFHIAAREYLAAARESNDPAIAERATRIAVYAREDTAAREAAALWAKLQPNSIRAHEVAAAMYVRQGDIGKAHSQLERVLAISKEGEHRTFMLITALLSKEKDKKVALKVMHQLVASRKNNPQALYAYAQLAMLFGDLDQAQQAAEKVRSLRPGWADTHILLSNIEFRQGHKAKALASLHDAVEHYPKNRVLRDFYARRLVDQKQYKEAREQFKELLNQYPQDHEAEYALGLLSMQLHDLDTAESYFKHLVKIKSRAHEASYYLGQIAEQRDHQTEAIRWYEKVTGGRYQVDAQIHVALIEARLGKVEQARERLHQIVPQSAAMEQRLYLAEGEILNNAKRYKKAYDLYNQALDKMPDNLALLYARALTAEKLNKTDAALADLKKIIDADPQNVQALNAYGYTLVDQTKRIKEGFKYVQRAYNMQSDDPAILDSMGWAYYRMGNYPKAIKYLRKALNALKDPEIAAHLGEVLWVSGDHAQARHVWDAARRETPSHKMLLKVIKRFTQ